MNIKKINKKKVLLLLSSRLGFAVIYLPVLALLNILKFLFPYKMFIDLVHTLNSTFDLVVVFLMFFFLYEFFKMIDFPYSIIYPFFSALSGFVLTKLIVEVLIVFVSGNIYLPGFLRLSEMVAYILLFILVLIFNFVKLLVNEIK